LVAKSLGDFEEHLKKFGFLRTHHSFLVNIHHIKRFVKEDGGYLMLTDEHKADVSKRKKDEILHILKMNSF
jgi:two-component system LytT family response regulator